MTDSTYELVLSPAPDLVVFEGGNAVVGCSPFLLPDSTSLALGMPVEGNRFVLVPESRLTQQDFVVPNSPFASNRTYTFHNVSRSEDREQLVCILGDLISNEVTLIVYGEYMELLFANTFCLQEALQLV